MIPFLSPLLQKEIDCLLLQLVLMNKSNNQLERSQFVCLLND